MARRSGIFETWEVTRLIGLGSIVLLTIFLAVLVSLPLGLVLPLTCVLLAIVWRPIGITRNSDKGEYRFNTLPMKIASFAMTYKTVWRQSLLSPVVSVGMGPPREDPDHDLEAGFAPMTRLSSYWALFGALGLGLIDFFTAQFRFPFWKSFADFTIPGFVMYPLSVIGFYVLIQSLLDANRQRADGTGLIGVEPAPAVILSKVRSHVDISDCIKKASMWGLIPVAIFAVVWIAAKIPLIIGLSITLGLFLLTFLIIVSKKISSQWRAQWTERNERRAHWSSVFSVVSGRIADPVFVGEAVYPTKDEWDMIHEGKEPEDVPAYAPSINMATFIYPPGTEFTTYSGLESKIKGMANAAQIVIAPIGDFNDDGQEQIGTVGSRGFRVWYSEREILLNEVMNPEVDNWTREFMTRVILDNMSMMRGLGEPILKSTNPMTRSNSTSHMIEVEFNVGSNDSIENYLHQLPAIRDRVLGVQWLGFHGSLNSNNAGNKTVTMLFGDKPKTKGIRFCNPARLVNKAIDVSNWNYAFLVSGLQGPGGLPRYIERRKSTDVVDQLLFELPLGTQFETVQGATAKLGSNSLNDFLEVSQGAEVNNKRRGNPIEENPRLFTLVAAEKDPLLRAFPWNDYQNQLLKPRVPGTPMLAWSPGVLANDELAIDDWDGDLPHLLIAGASGMGKSQLAMSMLMQLAHNNSPDELEFHFIEPKNELQTFEHVDTCAELVDSWTPDNNFMYNAAEAAVAMVVEMDRRYELMRKHPKQPKKLANARLIAQNEGPRPDGSKHPLDMPFKIFYIEECATLFADAVGEDKAEQGRLVAAVAELCRKARAAGIHLVFATQYPTNASIPSVMRNQCRRIGLGAQNRVASDVIIGQSGLEKISTPGLGMIKPKKDYRKFRGFWIKDGDPDFGGENDIIEVLKMIPQKQGNAIQKMRATAPRSQRFKLPNPNQLVFNTWQSSPLANAIENGVAMGKKSKDIDESKASSMAHKYGVQSEYDVDENGDLMDEIDELMS